MEYEEHRRDLLRSRLTTVALAVLGIAVAFEAVALLMVPEQWHHEWKFNVILVAVPLVTLTLRWTPLRDWPMAIYLGTDLIFTAAFITRLLQPAAFTSGIEAFASIKLMGTAVLIPWSASMQALSATLTVAFYWLVFWISGRAEPTTGDLPHQLTSPVFAALLSIVGVYGADRLRRKLFLQRREAEHQARVSSHFAATMSHELRNLLTAMHGYGEMLGIELEGDPRAGDLPERLQKIAREALEIINVTLDLSRAERRVLDVRLQEVSLGELFAELREEFARAGRAESVRLDWYVEPEDLRLRTDGLKLAMILRNLTVNALKFTPRGEVRVTATPSPGGVSIAVADTGSGIPADSLAHIFEPFYQAGREGHASGSAGLGLYVVQRLVEALGGTIRVDSVLGGGSTFRVELPAT